MSGDTLFNSSHPTDTNSSITWIQRWQQAGMNLVKGGVSHKCYLPQSLLQQSFIPPRVVANAGMLCG